MWNLEKWWWTYLQGRNKDADIENRRVDTKWEEESGMNWKVWIDIYTQSHVKEKASGDMLYSTETWAQWSVMT